jgi:dTDP-4-dehydrorhamnose reductase
LLGEKAICAAGEKHFKVRDTWMCHENTNHANTMFRGGRMATEVSGKTKM